MRPYFSLKEAVTDSWNSVKRSVIETAKRAGLKMVEGAESELHQAVYFLTFKFNTQDFLIGVYALAAFLKKIEDRPDFEVSVSDADHFFKDCLRFTDRLPILVKTSIA